MNFPSRHLPRLLSVHLLWGDRYELLSGLQLTVGPLCLSTGHCDSETEREVLLPQTRTSPPRSSLRLCSRGSLCLKCPRLPVTDIQPLSSLRPTRFDKDLLLGAFPDQQHPHSSLTALCSDTLELSLIHTLSESILGVFAFPMQVSTQKAGSKSSSCLVQL